MVLFTKLLIKWDYYKATRGNFPTKRLVLHCMANMEDHLEYEYQQVAHMYAFDSTVSENKLRLIHTCYDTCTKERVRQLLMKFVRKYYK